MAIIPRMKPRIAVTGTRGTADITPHVLVFVLGGSPVEYSVRFQVK